MIIWNPSTEQWPDNTEVLVAYENTYGGIEYKVAKYTTPLYEEETCGDWDVDDLDYVEATDTYYIPEGWYETCPGGFDYSYALIHKPKLIAWADLSKDEVKNMKKST